jgi:hypothetical protein
MKQWLYTLHLFTLDRLFKLCFYGNEKIIASQSLFSGAFAILQKAIVGFIMFVHLPACMEQLGSHWMDFDEIWYFELFSKLSRKFKFY